MNEHPCMNRFDQHTTFIYRRNFLYPALKRISELHFSDSLEQDRNGWNITTEGKQTVESSRKPKNKWIDGNVNFSYLGMQDVQRQNPRFVGFMKRIYSELWVPFQSINRSQCWGYLAEQKHRHAHIYERTSKEKFLCQRRVKATLMTVGAIIN